MAETKVDIWNRALSRIGVTDLLEDEDDDRPEAKLCALHWDDVLREALGAYPWVFARGQKAIAELADVTRVGWEHVYALPADFVAPVGIVSGETRLSLVPGEEQEPYEIQANDAGDGRVLCCDLAPGDIDALAYTRLISVATLYPPAFTSAVAFALAAELALSIQKDNNLARVLIAQANFELSRAFATDCRGRRDRVGDVPPSSIRARS